MHNFYDYVYPRNKYRGTRSLDETVQQNKHRMAARGNATSFPLPWQDLMGQLQDSERLVALGQNTPLPRTGAQLSEVVSILLQTAG